MPGLLLRLEAEQPARGLVRLARAVYFENDERARIKREINVKLGSALVEEKSYQDYRVAGS